MKKKWTFLLAAGLLAGATPVFTGCIDNDEPEGISILRGAKAELIRAKVAVQDAIAAEKLANAELTKAQAEVQKQIAAIKEAVAAKKQAEAEAEKAMLDAKIKEAEAKAEEALAKAKKEQQKADDLHKQAMAELAEAQANMMEAQGKVLNVYTRAYNTAKDKYYNLKEEYLNKLHALTQAQQDPETLNSWKDIKLQENAVAEAQATLEKQKAKVEGLKKELDGFDIKPGELGLKYNELKKKDDSYNNSLKALNLKLEQVKYDNQAAFEKKDELVASKSDILAEELTVDKYSVELPAWVLNQSSNQMTAGSFPILRQDLLYSLNNVQNYTEALGRFDNRLLDLKEFLFNDNDEAWMREQITYTEKEMLDYQQTLNQAKDKWTRSVAAYKTGTGELDYTQYANYSKLDEAVKAHNDLLPAYNEAKQAKADAELAVQNAAADKNRAETAKATYDREYIEAYEQVTEVENRKAAKIETESKKWEAEHDRLKIALYEAQNEYTKAELDYTNDPSNANKEIFKNAEKAYRTAEAALTNHGEAFDAKDIEAEFKPEIEAAKLQCDKDRADALLKFKKNTLAWNGENNIDPQWETKHQQAIKALNTATAKFNKAQDKVNVAFANANRKAYDFFRNNLYIYNYSCFGDVPRYRSLNLQNTLKQNISEELAIRAIELNSKDLYGEKFGNRDRLLPLGKTQAEEIAELKKMIKQKLLDDGISEVQNWQVEEYILNNRSTLGVYGNVMYNETYIAQLKSTIANKEAVTKLIADVEAKRGEIVAAYEAQNKKKDEADEAILAQEEIIEGLIKPVNDEISALNKEYAAIQDLLEIMQDVIANKEDPNNFTQEDVDGFKAELEKKVKNNEKKVQTYQEQLADEQNALDDLKNQKLTKVNLLQHQTDMAEARMKDAEGDMNAAELRLKAVIARLEKSVQ